MPIVRITTPREISWEIYNQVDARIQAEEPPDGLILHTAVENNGRPKIIDVWESEEHADRFGQERLGPMIAEVAGPEMGGPPEPDQVEVWQIKSMMRGA